MTRFLFSCLFLSVVSTTFSQTYKNPKAPVEDRVKDLLSRMTLEEKIDYIGGQDDFYIRGIERLGLPKIKMSDGPVGVRNYGPTTAYPASILTAATWDTELARRLGEALGKDARQRGVHILLGPGVNIYRAPMNGRNFEYLGEDPFLAGKMAAAYIRGVQSQKVVATVKHFAANNQEWDRNNVSSDMDERTLHEIYLPAFRMAVQEGEVGAVMDSYNLINGIHATQNGYLNNEVLKTAWGFDGIVMSDWVATYDGVAAANGGLDLEMPSGAFMNRQQLLPAIKDGRLSEEVINDKVRRILRIIFRFGFYDTPYKETPKRTELAESADVALDLARNGIVLLKNENQLLPLSKSVRKVAVIGPNGNRNVAGGGSSFTRPFGSTSLVDGIQKALPQARVEYMAAASPRPEEFTGQSNFYTKKGSKEKGLIATYFNSTDLSGAPVATRTDANINHDWADVPGVKGIGADHFSIRFTGVIRPTKSATYTLAVRGDDGFRLFVDGKNVLDLWGDHAAMLKTVTMPMEANQEYDIRLEYYENAGDAVIVFAAYEESIDFRGAEEMAARADAVVLSVGFDASLEGEGFDRPFGLPKEQEQLIRIVSRVNPNTVVVLNAGGNVDMRSWLPQVKALVHAWYPGEKGGYALAEILFGDVNPSGKLPVSFEKRWEDNPVYPFYYDPDGNKRVSYGERLGLGYRYFDRANVKPQFPFGFGLSYTQFEYSALKVTGDVKDGFEVTFTIKNVGARDGAESAQVYVRQDKPTVERPEKELKGFTKVFLKKGESKMVSVFLRADAFSYYRTDLHRFAYDKGDFEILVGASSADIRLKAPVQL